MLDAHDGCAGGSDTHVTHGVCPAVQIMGAAYMKTLTTFDKGEYAGATNMQVRCAPVGARVCKK
jgi:hypothetical protein